MNIIHLSDDRQFVELWHNGAKIRWHALTITRLHDAVDELRRYIHSWAGDDNPEIGKTLQDCLKASDVAFQRMAFGEHLK